MVGGNVMVTKLLITGGAGFMGSNMIHYLLNQNDDVEIVNVDKLTYAGNLDNLKDIVGHPRYTFIKADIADEKAMSDVFKRFTPQVILNYAAETHVDRSISKPNDFIVTDVIGTFTLLEQCRAHNAKRFIQISTDEVFGSTDGIWNEQTAFDPSSPYSASKAGADHLVHAYWRTYGLPTIVTHSCNFYGPNQYPEKLIPLFITNLMEQKKVPIYGDGKQVREWIYTTDHCNAIATIMEHGKDGEVYNIGTGERKTNLDVTRALLSLLHVADDMIEYVNDRPGHDRRYALDSTKLRTTLGWKPDYTFERGLQNTVDWYRNNEWWWQKIKSGDFMNYYRAQYQQSKE